MSRANIYTRRRLRLGALLYQLRYYAIPDQLDDQGEIRLYRYDREQYVEITGSTVHLVRGDSSEILDLEEAIVRFKAALASNPLHNRAE